MPALSLKITCLVYFPRTKCHEIMTKLPEEDLLCGVGASAELLSFQFLTIAAQISCRETEHKHTL